MRKLSKKIKLAGAVLLMSAFSWSAWAACTASPWWCSLTASATIPPGGTCSTFVEHCFARVITFDSSGNLYDTDFVRCPNCIDP